MIDKRILVAGATGYLGRYVVKCLKRDGWFVRVLVRSEQKLGEAGQGLAPVIHNDVDEIVVGDVTRPDTLRGVANGMSAVFSSVSLMAQTGPLTWHDVDYLGNLNILQEAQRAGVQKFVYVSLFNAEQMLDIPIVKAHEDFATELTESSIDYTIVRPTGYFSDLGAFLSMAQAGRVYLLGNGRTRINPIHGADLARICVDAFDSNKHEIDAGGPEVLTQRDIAETAFAVLGKTTRTTTIPEWLARSAIRIVYPFQRSRADLWRFFVSSATLDNVAPTFGKRRLIDHYRAQVKLLPRASTPEQRF
jgi:uncharacterized protein YbjT (DUF2867 family)